jgi:hypothetical protein
VNATNDLSKLHKPSLRVTTPKTPAISVDELRHLFRYEPQTGLLYYRVAVKFRSPGDLAGSLVKNGKYRTVKFRRANHLAHRVIWAMETGEWPAHPIDHINGDGLDNRMSNLRLSINGINAQNLRSPRKDNTTGFLGVQMCFGKFKAVIRVKPKRYDLGVFSTPEEAYAAYLNAKRMLHEGNTL